MTRKYQTSSKKLVLTKKQASFDNSQKEGIEREFDNLLAEEPKNCIEQVTLKEVQSAKKDLNSYSAPGPGNRYSAHQKWRWLFAQNHHRYSKYNLSLRVLFRYMET